MRQRNCRFSISVVGKFISDRSVSFNLTAEGTAPAVHQPDLSGLSRNVDLKWNPETVKCLPPDAVRIWKTTGMLTGRHPRRTSP